MRSGSRHGWAAMLLGAMAGASAGPGGAASAQEPAVRETPVVVERAGDAVVEGNAGEVVTVAFRIISRGRDSVTAVPEVSAPAGWRLVVPGSEELRLAPADTAVRMVGAAVPGRSPPGTYPVRLSVSRAAGAGEGAVDSVLIRVSERAALSVRHVEAPRLVVGGESYTTTFLVRNRGNVPLEVLLEPRSSHGFPARPSSPRLRLAPDESERVPVRVETAEIRSEGRSTVRLVARADAGAGAADTASTSVTVLPPTPPAGPRFQRVPTTVAFRGAAVGEAVPPVEVSGAGPSSPTGRDRIEFLFRGPETERPSFGMRDEYRVGYRSPWLELRLGDQSYRLSRLTEPGRYGFGGGGALHLGPVSVGGFHSTDRRSALERDETGVFLELRPGPEMEMGVYGLQRTGPDEGRILSGRAGLRPSAALDLSGEMAVAVSPAGEGEAATVRARGRTPRLSYDVHYIRADTTFPSFFSGIEHITAGATFRPFGWLSLDGYFQDLTDRGAGFERDTRVYRAGIGLAGRLTVRAEHAELHAPHPADPVAGEEERVEARLSLGGTAFRLGLGGVVGRLVDTLAATDPESRFYESSGWLRMRRGPIRFGGSVEYRNGASLYVRGFEERWTARVDAGLRLADTDISLSAYGTRNVNATRRDNFVLNGRLRQRLLFGHELAVRAYAASDRLTAFDRTIVLVDYRIPLGIPVRPLPRRGQVSGRLYDAVTGAGLGRVPVRLGPYTVVTDPEGAFVFRDLGPGTYHLQVERAGGAAGRVPLITLPEALTVGERELPRVEIGFVEPASVEGRVRLLGFDPEADLAARDPELVEAGGLAGVRLELEDGDILRRVTGPDGRFSFRELRPGRWTLRVVDAPVPEHHELREDSLVFDLEPGGRYEAELRVEEVARPIRSVPGGELRVEPAAPGEVAEPAGPPEPSPAGTRIYVVGPEDLGLFNIARKLYGNANLWPKLWVANRDSVPDANKVHVGQRLRVPPAGPLTAAERAARAEYYRSRRQPRP